MGKNGMMKALVAHDVQDYRLEQIPIPVPGRKDILIKVEACGICAGDIKAGKGAKRFWGGDGMPGYCEPPFIPGHEFFGKIVAMGSDVPGQFEIGDRIISEQIVPCGHCHYCLRGQYWLCIPHNVYGFKKSFNGGMAEYALLPAGSINHKIPADLSTEEAVLIEPYSCSLHAVRRAQITVDDVVVLAGAGTLGLGMVGAIHQRNPKLLIVLDYNDHRLEIAKKFGADIIINPRNESSVDRVLDLTDGLGCSIYIEATGHPSAVNQGLEMIRKGGTFVEFSVFAEPVSADWSIIGDVKELTILGSQLSPHCYSDAIAAISQVIMSTEGVVTHQYKLEDWKEAFEKTSEADAIKVIITP